MSSNSTAILHAVCFLLQQLHDGAPIVLDVDAGGDELGSGLLQGRAGEDVGATNQKPIKLGMLKDDLEETWAMKKLDEEDEKLARATGGGAVGVGGEGGMVGGAQEGAGGGAGALSKKAKAAKDKARETLRTKRKEIEDSRLDPPLVSGIGLVGSRRGGEGGRGEQA